MDRDQARAEAAALLDRWELDPDRRDQLVESLTASDALTVEQVGALDRANAPELLAAIAEAPVPKELRKSARRGLHRVRATGRAVPSIAPSERGPSLHRVETSIGAAQVTAADGLGSRWLWLFVERSTGGGYAVGLIVNEIVGLKGCMVNEVTRRRFKEQVDSFGASIELDFVELPVDYARALLAEAVQRNEITGYALPTDFQTYRTLLGDLGAPPERALISEYVNAAEIRLEPTWLAASAELLGEPEIARWYLDFHQLRPFAEQLRQADSSMVVIHEQSRQERIERIETEAIRAIFPDDVRRGMRRRLEETAYVFWKSGRERAAKLAVAAAIGLEEPLVASSSIIVRVSRAPDQAQHPFILALLRVSLEVTSELELRGQASRIPHRTAYTPIDD